MKKKILSLMLIVLLIASVFTGCSCEHEYTTSITKEATCAAEGEITKTCTKCGEEIKEVIPKAENHDYGSNVEVIKEATCAEDGEKKYTCSVCGEVKTETITKLNSHKFAEKITKKATCGANGEKTLTCSVCGITKTEIIAKTTTHSTEFGKCSVCGTKVKNLLSTYETILEHMTDGSGEIVNMQNYISQALKSKYYSGTGSAVISCASAAGAFANAAKACGDHKEFAALKSKLIKMDEILSNTFSGNVSIYGDARDLTAIGKMLDAIDAVKPYLNASVSECKSLSEAVE